MLPPTAGPETPGAVWVEIDINSKPIRLIKKYAFME